MEKLRLSVVAIWHVQRVLAKKRDPLTHVLFIDEGLEDDSPLPSEQIWYVWLCWADMTTCLFEYKPCCLIGPWLLLCAGCPLQRILACCDAQTACCSEHLACCSGLGPKFERLASCKSHADAAAVFGPAQILHLLLLV